VSLGNRLRTIVVCALLEMGAMSGAPMRVKEVDELMGQLNQLKLAHVLPAENEEGSRARRTNP